MARIETCTLANVLQPCTLVARHCTPEPPGCRLLDVTCVSGLTKNGHIQVCHNQEPHTHSSHLVNAIITQGPLCPRESFQDPARAGGTPGETLWVWPISLSLTSASSRLAHKRTTLLCLMFLSAVAGWSQVFGGAAHRALCTLRGKTYKPRCDLPWRAVPTSHEQVPRWLLGSPLPV